MTPDNPFLRALLADPDDDTLRLALADWLDEDGQPARAEFVRVQIELARGVADRDRRRHLELRQRDLLVAHDAEWVAPLAEVLDCKPGRWGGWVFRRGFVEYFRLPAQTLVTHGGRLARLTPVRELNLVDTDWAGECPLWREPWVRSVTHLYGVALDSATAEDLLACPFLTGLRVLASGWNHLDDPSDSGSSGGTVTPSRRSEGRVPEFQSSKFQSSKLKGQNRCTVWRLGSGTLELGTLERI